MEVFILTWDRLASAVHGSGYAILLLFQALYWIRSAFIKRREILAQMYVCGFQSLPVTMVVAAFTGMILALQTGLELKKYGRADIIGAVVSISLCREMASFMCGLICAANVGSAMAAELGTMKVSEEIDALEVMGIDPARFLVMPRVVAMTIMTPILAILTNVVGNIGAAIVGYYRLYISFDLYYRNAIDILDLKDIYSGLFKAMVYGLVIAIVSCAQGLRAKGGALGVGRAVRSSVIICFLLIIILGYIMTAVFYGEI